MSENPLEKSKILDAIVQATTSSANEAEGSSSSATSLRIRNRHDLIVALIHAILTQIGFEFIGSEETPVRAGTVQLPLDWNTGEYSLRYSHHQSSLTYQIKCVTLGKQLIVAATYVEDDKTVHQMTINVGEQVSTDPSHLSSRNGLNHAFWKFDELVNSIRTEIVQKLAPGIIKPGYQEIETSRTTAQPQSTSSTYPTPTQPDPLRVGPPRQPSGPYFGDYDPLRTGPPRQPSRPNPSDYDPLRIGPPRNPFVIGDRDRNPMGLPSSPFGGDNGGGMFVGPNHPMFGGFPGPGGSPGYPDSFLPPGAAPPGARFDPILPPGVRPPRPRPNPPRSGDPDNDMEPMPHPNWGNDYI